MSYPSLRRRRQRRRRTLIILAIAVIGIGAAYGVTRVQSEEARQRTYLDQAFDIVAAEQSAATRFVSLIVGLEDLRRTTMVSTLEMLELQTSDLADALAEIAEPEGSTLKAHLFLQIAVTRWRAGMSSMREGMVTLSGSSLDRTGIAQVTQGLTDLRVGDSAYAGFLGELVDVDTTLQGGTFPRVTFISADNRALFDPTEVARRLFLTPSLGVTTNVAVADVGFDPTPLGEQDGLPVIPSGQGLDVVVAIANTGNVEVEGTLVRLILVSSDGDRFEDDRLVGALVPGEVTSLSFEGLPVAVGTIYELTARIEGVDDDPLDDTTAFVFVMGDES